MADFLNLQINSVHIAMYSMVGLTTAVLAYATAGGALENFTAKTMSALSPTALIGSESVAALGNLTPFGSGKEENASISTSAKEPQPEQPQEPQEPQEPPQEQPQPQQNATDESLSSLAVETGQESPEEGEGEEKATGGKKRRRKKTPKHHKSKKHNKSIKSKR